MFYTTEFEFDKHKSLLNRQKHGIDFDEAQLLWEDANLMIIPARTEDEPSSVIIGKIGDRHWSAAITLRGGRIRIISVRRSRKEEVELYES
ncbi:MAG: BrnT family toxin [Candidatus Hydrogenedentes bacterium]|nr:BrnT family toxin [Candidatus Hydrogenedentota bacterium]